MKSRDEQILKIKNIIVFKETQPGEKRVALTPQCIPPLSDLGVTIWVEESAGVNSGYQDSDYIKHGAKIISFNAEAHLPSDSLLLRVKRAIPEREEWEMKVFKRANNLFLMGFLNPFNTNRSHLSFWQQASITTFSLDLLKLTANNPMNVLAPMSEIAGELAMDDALSHWTGVLPPRVGVIGLGSAGRAAAMHAANKGFPVKLFGRTEVSPILLKENMVYVRLNKDEQRQFPPRYLEELDIIITAAREPGKQAPILIEKIGLDALPDKAVVLDLAGDGQNIRETIKDKVVQHYSSNKSVLIINNTGYPKKVPNKSSNLFAQALTQLILELLSPTNGKIFRKKIYECCLTENSQLNTSIFKSVAIIKTNYDPRAFSTPRLAPTIMSHPTEPLRSRL